MSPILFYLLTAPSALAWPGDADWTSLTVGGTPLEDPADDVGRQRADLVGDTADPAGAWFVDADALYLRMRINSDPCLTGYTKGGCKLLDPEAWGFLLSSDGDDQAFGAIVVLHDNGTTLGLHPNTDGGTDWDDDFDSVADWTVSYPVVSGNARVLLASSSFTLDEDYFIDMMIPLAQLANTLGSDYFVNLKVALVTEQEFLLSIDDALETDLGGADNRSSVDLASVLSDPLELDADGDGLLLGDEALEGTDPDDADTDDDGVLDGEEVLDYGSDPLECDTDEDGLTDGLELGRTESSGDTDPEVCFVADADPSTTTSPLLKDTDSGGVPDGEEDVDGDGEVDTWETDPNDPSDDADTDQDGIPDALEEACDAGGSDTDADGDGVLDVDEGRQDSDGDGDPDFCDTDDDGDTIPTAEEGDTSVDTDDDGVPDYLDEDSDNDGADDIDEGTGDEDCDDIRNFQDANDTDGPCAEPGDTGPSGGTDTGNKPTYGFTGGSFTGGACSALPAGATFIPALVAFIALSRRRRYVGGAVLLGLPVLLLPSPATAQEVNAQLYQPAIDSWRFSTVEDTVVGDAGFGGGLSLNYADDPFIYRYEDDTAEEVALLKRAMTTDVMAYGNIRSVRVGMALPLHLVSDGYAFEDAGARVLGDVGLDAKVELMDRMSGPLGLSAGLRADLPTGNGAAFLGDANTTVEARLGASTGTTIVVAGDVGFQLAADDADQIFAGLTTGSRLTFGLGVSAQLKDPIWASAELTGQRLLSSAGEPGATPLEGLVALHASPLQDRRLVTTLGGGAGLTPGLGSPDFRAVASVGWHPVRRPVISNSPDVHGNAVFEYVINITDASGLPVEAWMQIPDRALNLQAGPDGSIRGTMPVGTYEIVITADGYLRSTRVLQGEDTQRISMEVVLIQPRVSIGSDRLEVSERIFFELDSDTILTDSHSLLDEVAMVLKEHPEIRLLEIQGHTDDQGSTSYNQELSQNRAESVRRYLLSRGIDPQRLRATGYGESVPLQEDTSEEARAINRRVEFVMVEVD